MQKKEKVLLTSLPKSPDEGSRRVIFTQSKEGSEIEIALLIEK
jgi:hypothetical protein